MSIKNKRRGPYPNKPEWQILADSRRLIEAIRNYRDTHSGVSNLAAQLAVKEYIRGKGFPSGNV